LEGFKAGNKFEAAWYLLKTVLTRVPDLDRWESERGYPMLNNPVLAHNSEEWLESVKKKSLLPINGKRKDSKHKIAV
jgi:hypothetical protein